MKMEKKLKRGLADLSNLFSGSGIVQHNGQESRRQSLVIEPPEDVISDPYLPHPVGVSFLHSPEILQAGDLIWLIEALNTVFYESYVLSVASDRARYEAFARILPIPPWKDIRYNSTISFHSVGERISFARISHTQLQNMIQAKINPSSFHYSAASKEKALAVFDSAIPNGSPSLEGDGIFELIDHCVFVIAPDPSRLEHIYELTQSCLARNHSLYCSILLVGRGAETLWESIYERASSIVSRSVGCDLGFLGWIENDYMQLNPELLLGERENLVQLSARIRLCEVLYNPVLNA